MGHDTGHLFPLVRHLSGPLSRGLLRLPVTPNQVTAASLATGMGSAMLLAYDPLHRGTGAALLLVLCYLLDNCDGEIARARGLSTPFGAFFDTLTDWLVHAAFFLGLGIGYTRLEQNWLWLGLGLAAAAGGTLNYLLGLRHSGAADEETDEAHHRPPPGASAGEWLLFAFREISRADFCFIALLLALSGRLWLLLPAGAIGAQAYWLTRFSRHASRYHV